MAARSAVEQRDSQDRPEVVIVDGPAGPRAHLAGTGLDVFEIVRTWQKVDGDIDRLAEAYDWLTRTELCFTLNFYHQSPAAIDARLVKEQSADLERLQARIAAAQESSGRK